MIIAFLDSLANDLTLQIICILYMLKNMGILAAKLTKSNLSQKDIETKSNEVIKRILSHSSPLLIYLFGSAANRTMTMASDFDFAIIFPDNINSALEKKKILNLNLFPDLSLDILFFNEKEFMQKSDIGGVCWEIKNKGIILYDQRTKV